jgi:hypothetical protein
MMNNKTANSVLLVLAMGCSAWALGAGEGSIRNDTNPSAPTDNNTPRSIERVPVPQPTQPDNGQSRPGSIDGAIDMRPKAAPAETQRPSAGGATALPGDNSQGHAEKQNP